MVVDRVGVRISINYASHIHVHVLNFELLYNTGVVPSQLPNLFLSNCHNIHGLPTVSCLYMYPCLLVLLHDDGDPRQDPFGRWIHRFQRGQHHIRWTTKSRAVNRAIVHVFRMFDVPHFTGFPFCLHFDRFEIAHGQRRQQFFQPTVQQMTAAFRTRDFVHIVCQKRKVKQKYKYQ